MPAGVQQVGVQADELRQRDRLDRAPLERGRPREAPARELDLRERVERIDVAGEGPQRFAEVAVGRGEVPAGELELSQLPLGPGERLPLVGGRIACEQQRGVGAVVVAEQLARVGDPGVRRDTLGFSRAIVSKARKASG